jgi:2-polyprenyl-6-methoxyphenol hydroxylase-like FAD-dependent oxidoreductase
MSPLSPAAAATKSILIVGGGGGGLTLALTLHRAGIASRVVMKDASFSVSGGAVCLMSGASRILDRLGLGTRVRSIGLPATRGEVYARSGKLLFAHDLAHNSLLQIVPRSQLRQALVNALPPGCVQMDTTFKGLAETKSRDTVSVRLRQNGEDLTVRAGLVVGADGNRSSVRKALARPGHSSFTGVTAFRAVATCSDLDTYPMHIIREVWDDGDAQGRLRFGSVRMTPDKVYWWASMCGADHVSDNIVLRPFGRKLSEQFSTFPFRAASLIAQHTIETAIDRSEIRSNNLQFPWVGNIGKASIALLGDAARQNDLPYFHHGSSLAIEDAYALGYAIAGETSLHQYEATRRSHTEVVSSLWARFDALAGTRHRISRYFLSRSLAFSMSRHQDATNAALSLTPSTLK